MRKGCGGVNQPVAPGGGSWHAIIDCAQDERLHGLVGACRDKLCLFQGDIIPKLAAAAPWLVRLDKLDPLMGIWEQHGRGQNWGIMCDSDMGLKDLHRHFRRFLQARVPPTGVIALFRFYDPRVFNTYIRAALPEEREPWFKGVRQYAAEGAEGTMHQYQLHGGQLLDGNTPLG